MDKRAGVRMQAGESYSEKYEGFISKGDGIYRKPLQWTNKKERLRSVNRYYLEVPCTICGSLHLTDRNNYRKSKAQICSKNCRTSHRSNPDGSKKLKRGAGSDSYVLVKNPQHPHADKTGHVPEHRLIVEKKLGRQLTRSEKVHHINCRKSDNRMENLYVCANTTEHNNVHASLNRCVADLISSGLLVFDQENKEYRVSDAVLIGHYGLAQH